MVVGLGFVGAWTGSEALSGSVGVSFQMGVVK